MTSNESLQGKTLGQYQLQDIIGHGAMSTVYRALQTKLRRDVAFKVLSPMFAAQPDFGKHFGDDLEKVAQLEHAYIAPVYDYGIEDETIFIVMRLLTGGSLAERMQHVDGNPRLPSLYEANELLLQLANALDYAHSRGILHGGLKPQNVLFDGQNNPLLVDFGVGRLMRMLPAMTGTGIVLGSPAYMSPEQWRGDTLTGASDQYILGIILYQLITGALPFDAPTPFALMHMHMMQAPTPPHERRAEIPEAVSAVLLRSLAKTPPERFESIMDFSRAFKQAIQNVDEEAVNFFERPVKPAAVQQHIFLSYSRADSDMMGRVRDDLANSGFKVWTDGNLTPGTPSWKDGIEHAIEGANCLVVILSPDSKQSEWVKRELDYALAYGLPIFPLLARGDERTAVPFALISSQRVDIRENYPQGLQNLTAAIRQQVKM